jgi:hypothetical protein
MEALPRLPAESSLTPADRPAWPLEQLRAFLASEKPDTARWAVHRAASRRDVQPKDVLRAVARLLDHDDEDVIEPTLEELGEFAGHPAARGMAEAIARGLPFGEGTHAHSLALRALTELAPADHVKAFADGLESGDEGVVMAALNGIAAGASEGAVIHLLAFTARASTPVCAAVAVTGLVDVRAEEFVERGARVLMYRFLSEGESLAELYVDLEEYRLTPMDLFVRIEESLFPGNDARDAAVRRSVLFPTADLAAARRAEQVVGPKRADRILALADAGEHTELVPLIGDLALEALEVASRENPAFGPLGRSLAGLVRSTLEWWNELDEVEPDDGRVAACILGTLLAKAVRGRDMEEELEEAGGDRTKLLDLCRVDEDWVDTRTFELLARVLREEDAVSLSGSTDSSVGRIGSFLIAAMDPGRHARKTIADFAAFWHLEDRLFRGLFRVAGDAVLPPLVDAVRANLNESSIDLLVTALDLLGTERARVCLEHSLDTLLKFHVLGVLRAAGATASRVAAEKAIEAIRKGDINVPQTAYFAPDPEGVRAEMAAWFDVLEIPGDADEIVEAVEEAGLQDDFEEGEEDRFEDDDEEEGDEDDGAWFDPDASDAPEPVAPIIRDAPKVGRNDPCPCGSGKKHKKCCGKGS